MSDFWEINARNWATVIQTQGIASRKTTSQALLRLMTSLSPQSVLDLGCGEGWLAEPMIEQGIYYRGLDGSQGLVEIAEQRRPGLFALAPYGEIQKIVWSVPKSWKSNYDIVVFNFSLLDQNLNALIKKAKTLLTLHGHIVIQTLHPAHLPEGKEGWNTEDFASMSGSFNGTMPWYGRPLEAWEKLFEECGLEIEQTIEPVHDGKPASILFSLIKAR